MSYAAQMMVMPPAENRSSIRRVVNFAATVRDNPSTGIQVLDLSGTGCRLSGDHGLEKGARIWLKITGLFALHARVEWVGNGEAGCHFDVPLHSSALDALIADTRRRSVGALGASRHRPPPFGAARRGQGAGA
jgi:hypothetical protein